MWLVVRLDFLGELERYEAKRSKGRKDVQCSEDQYDRCTRVGHQNSPSFDGRDDARRRHSQHHVPDSTGTQQALETHSQRNKSEPTRPLDEQIVKSDLRMCGHDLRAMRVYDIDIICSERCQNDVHLGDKDVRISAGVNY